MADRRLPALGALALLLVPILSGCSGDADRDRGATRVVHQFLAAVKADDGQAACALLAPATRETLERDAQAPCASALLDEDLPPAGDDVETAVYGMAAQVRTTTDTVFLATFDGAWRISAVGCAAAGEGPYECAVEGG